VGAWLALRHQQGELGFDYLVPEGLEDLSREGPAGWQIQVKSRQARVGDFLLGRRLDMYWMRGRVTRKSSRTDLVGRTVASSRPVLIRRGTLARPQGRRRLDARSVRYDSR
jgi:hypothetical protein